MIWIALFVTAALTVILLITLSNLIFFPRLQIEETQTHSTKLSVSVMIPARDEAPVIEQTVRALLAQDYADFGKFAEGTMYVESRIGRDVRLG